MAHLFGPVPSRRLGRSLGVDLIPPKTCPYDCIYCEVGPTTEKTLRRREYQVDDIIAELATYLSRPSPEPDFITLAGSGEPTLNLGLGRIIQAIKEMTATPVAVLTNGALLSVPEVRESLMAADVVLPSLDAAREETFQAINRPAPELSLEQGLAGLVEFRRTYPGRVWLEVMILPHVNDGDADLLTLRQAIQQIAPEKVQLNTAVRPGVAEGVRPMSPEGLRDIAAFLGGPVEVIASFRRRPGPPAAVSDADFLEALSRRPMTPGDLAQALGLPVTLVQQRLKHLHNAGLIFYDHYQEKDFYRSQSP